MPHKVILHHVSARKLLAFKLNKQINLHCDCSIKVVDSSISISCAKNQYKKFKNHFLETLVYIC